MRANKTERQSILPLVDAPRWFWRTKEEQEDTKGGTNEGHKVKEQEHKVKKEKKMLKRLDCTFILFFLSSSSLLFLFFISFIHPHSSFLFHFPLRPCPCSSHLPLGRACRNRKDNPSNPSPVTAQVDHHSFLSLHLTALCLDKT